MTAKQAQHLLAYLGYYTMDVDGIWGPGSQAACRRFQQDRGLTTSSCVGPELDEALLRAVYNDLKRTLSPLDQASAVASFWDDSEFFNREEFRCQCGGKYCDGFPVEPTKELVAVCNEIRRRLGVPISIVDAGGSGVRCAQHNADVGGVGNSNHLYGNAADLHSSKSPEEMYRVAEKVLGNTGELGLYTWGIHVGVNCTYSRF